MDIQNGALFLINCLLAMGGFVILAGGALVINNMLSKYWKPIRLVRYEFVEKVIESEHKSN